MKTKINKRNKYILKNTKIFFKIGTANLLSISTVLIGSLT
jgi:hypothetical protein